MILKQLGIFGWKEADENLVLASLLTGDPLLLIGNYGLSAFLRNACRPSCVYLQQAALGFAKTHAANKVAQAPGRTFLVYDASKAMFEDVLGYPNVEKLKRGAGTPEQMA